MISCFKHSKYKGLEAPELSCKTCCHIFIEHVKKCRDEDKPYPSMIEAHKQEKRKAANDKY